LAIPFPCRSPFGLVLSLGGLGPVAGERLISACSGAARSAFSEPVANSTSLHRFWWSAFCLWAGGEAANDQQGL